MNMVSSANCAVQIGLPLLFFNTEKTPGGSKITKVNYKICFVVSPSLAGCHQ